MRLKYGSKTIDYTKDHFAETEYKEVEAKDDDKSTASYQSWSFDRESFTSQTGEPEPKTETDTGTPSNSDTECDPQDSNPAGIKKIRVNPETSSDEDEFRLREK
jgi:hypothetical protein